jgi:uncharacterized protein (TIGR03000 family)
MFCTKTRCRVPLACAVLLCAAAAAWAQATAEPATLVVYLPAGARLEVDGQLTRKTGEVRRFSTPPLEPGKRYRYDLRVTWKEGEKERVIEEVARGIQAGKETVVDLRPKTATEDKEPKEPKEPKEKEAKDKDKDKDKAKEKEPREPDVVFVPTPQEVVDKMLELAEVKKGDLVYDLGCGDGRIVVTAAKKYGCKAVGFDIDPDRVKDSLENVKKNMVEDLVTIKKADIFEQDLSKANVITLYLLPELNVKLIPQLKKLKPGSRIVSHDFDMKGIRPKMVVKVKPKEGGQERPVYLWVTPLEEE